MKSFLYPAYKLLALLAAAAAVALSPPTSKSEEGPWRKVDEGLFIGEFDPLFRSNVSSSKITIVKVDPKYHSFKLLCASEQGGQKMTVRKWCEKFGLLTAVNAGMYQKDGLTNVGYMKNFSHLNNPHLNKTYQAVLAFNPTEPKLPEIQIIDLKYQDFESLALKYQTLIQNIRMISWRQENVWVTKDQIWSMAVFGMDKGGNALLIFTEVPHSGHDFANTLLSLPISIFNALYLEGGPQANLFFSWKDVQLERVGRRETGFQEDSPRSVPRPVPNVIGVTRKIR